MVVLSISLGQSQQLSKDGVDLVLGVPKMKTINKHLILWGTV